MGSITIDKSTSNSRILNGHITITAGVRFTNHGIIEGDIYLGNSSLENYGIINGLITGNGIFVNYGIFQGNWTSNVDVTLQIGSIVNNNKINKSVSSQKISRSFPYSEEYEEYGFTDYISDAYGDWEMFEANFPYND